MILIKDRHYPRFLNNSCAFIIGKYDTYKGATQVFESRSDTIILGKYDTYKGSTLTEVTFKA